MWRDKLVSSSGVEALMRQALWDDAIQACQAALQVQPVNPRLHGYLGLCYFQKHEYLLASDSFQRATSLDPNFWQAGVKLAQSLERQRRHSEALEVTKQFLRVQPNDNTLQGLLQYLEDVVQDRTEAWERSRYLGYKILPGGG
jgi:protein O-GlcNAc transferase